MYKVSLRVQSKSHMIYSFIQQIFQNISHVQGIVLGTGNATVIKKKILDFINLTCLGETEINKT